MGVLEIKEDKLNGPNPLRAVCDVQGVEESVSVLKSAAKTRRVAKDEVLSALSVIKKAKLDPSGFLGTLGGSGSPGRTWMLVFTAQDWAWGEFDCNWDLGLVRRAASSLVRS
ncbi:hypothetical protein Sjap_015139 [Stephania japonica]|uniref:Uncharacterized protein n=1 Tax=Stephania japonica TaxID=461633 RepID=A0AAP0IKG3_9MAGN